MSPSRSKARIIVTGVVQGVGYRYYAITRARRYGLTGYAKNLPNGTVEVVAEGEAGLIRDYIGDLQVGPPSARVAGVEVTWHDCTGGYSSFGLEYPL